MIIPFKKRKTEVIPFSENRTRNLSLTIIFLVFLLGLLTFYAHNGIAFLEDWKKGIYNSLVVHVPNVMISVPSSPESERSSASLHQENAVSIVKKQLSLTPYVIGVREYKPLQGFAPNTMLDVTLKPGSFLKTQNLNNELNALVPGTYVESHSRWADTISDISALLIIAAGTLIFIIAFITVLVIALATQSGIIFHAQVVDTLRLIGSSYNQIAKLFQQNIFMIALTSSLIGTILGFFTWIFTGILINYFSPLILLKPQVTFGTVGIFIAIPLFISFLCREMARLSAMQALKKLEYINKHSHV